VDGLALRVIREHLDLADHLVRQASLARAGSVERQEFPVQVACQASRDSAEPLGFLDFDKEIGEG
jgi:hypothetical protein